MRSTHFCFSVAAFAAIVFTIAATPIVETVDQSLNSGAAIANNLVKRQSTPICSTVCGAPDLSDCIDVHEPSAQFCDTTTFLPGSPLEDCNISYEAPPDGACTPSNDLHNLIKTLRETCLSGSSPSGGCIDGSNGARICIFSSESPCH